MNKKPKEYVKNTPEKMASMKRAMIALGWYFFGRPHMSVQGPSKRVGLLFVVVLEYAMVDGLIRNVAGGMAHQLEYEQSRKK